MAYYILERMLMDYRDCAGLYDDEERRAFVDRFLYHDKDEKEWGGWILRPEWRPNLHDWMCEALETVIDKNTRLGEMLLDAFAEEIAEHDERLRDCLYDIVADLEDDTD